MIRGDYKSYSLQLSSFIPPTSQLVFQKQLIYPSEGTHSELISGVTQYISNFFSGGQIPEDLQILATGSLKTLYSEILQEGEQLVFQCSLLTSTNGSRSSYFRYSIGGYTYHLITLLRYQVALVNPVRVQQHSRRVLDLDHSIVAAAICGIVELQQSYTGSPLRRIRPKHESDTEPFSSTMPLDYTRTLDDHDQSEIDRPERQHLQYAVDL